MPSKDACRDDGCAGGRKPGSESALCSRFSHFHFSLGSTKPSPAALRPSSAPARVASALRGRCCAGAARPSGLTGKRGSPPRSPPHARIRASLCGDWAERSRRPRGTECPRLENLVVKCPRATCSCSGMAVPPQGPLTACGTGAPQRCRTTGQASMRTESISILIKRPRLNCCGGNILGGTLSTAQPLPTVPELPVQVSRRS